MPLFTPTPTDPNQVLQITVVENGQPRSAQSVRVTQDALIDFLFWLRKHAIVDSSGVTDTLGTPGWINSGNFNVNGVLTVNQMVLPQNAPPSISVNGVNGMVAAKSFSVQSGTLGHYLFDGPKQWVRPCRWRPKFNTPYWSETAAGQSANFYTQGGADTLATETSPPVSAHWAEFEVDLPVSPCKIIGLQWLIVPFKPSTPRVTLPGVMPRIQLLIQNLSTDSNYSVLADGKDQTTVLADYDKIGGHVMTVPNLDIDYGGSQQYVIRVRGENGSSALNGLRGFTPQIVYTTQWASEGG